MKAQLYFIYDCLCPWSYTATRLINAVDEQLGAQVETMLLNECRYENGELPSLAQVKQAEEISEFQFSNAYKAAIDTPQASTVTANLMAWVTRKATDKALPLLNAIQKRWFEQGLAINDADDLESVFNELKLSPPAKALKTAQPSKDAAYDLAEIESISEFTQTTAIPALLLAVGDNLILLSHNYYLNQPEAIVNAIKLELKSH